MATVTSCVQCLAGGISNGVCYSQLALVFYIILERILFELGMNDRELSDNGALDTDESDDIPPVPAFSDGGDA